MESVVSQKRPGLLFMLTLASILLAGFTSSSSSLSNAIEMSAACNYKLMPLYFGG